MFQGYIHIYVYNTSNFSNFPIFLSRITFVLFLFVNLIGVDSLLNHSHCKSKEDPLQPETFCFLDYAPNQIEGNRIVDTQTVVLFFRPKPSFIKLLVHHFKVQEEAIFEIPADSFVIDVWNPLNVTIVYRKSVSDSNSTIQYIINSKTFEEIRLRRPKRTFHNDVGLTFTGDFEGIVGDPQSFPQIPVPPSKTKLGPIVTYLIIACVVFLLLSLVSCTVAILQFRKASKKTKQGKINPTTEKKKDASRTLSDGSYGSYVNEKIKPQDEEDHYYEDDTYDESTRKDYQTIEQRAKALNKSVIELHFGM